MKKAAYTSKTFYAEITSSNFLQRTWEGECTSQIYKALFFGFLIKLVAKQSEPTDFGTGRILLIFKNREKKYGSKIF